MCEHREYAGKISKGDVFYIVVRRLSLLTLRDRFDTKTTYIDLRRLDPITVTTSSLVTTGTGMLTSAINIVAKPIQTFHHPKPATDADEVASKHGDSQDPKDIETYGRSAGTPGNNAP